MEQLELKILSSLSYNDFENILGKKVSTMDIAEHYGKFKRSTTDYLVTIDSDLFDLFSEYAKNRCKKISRRAA